VLDKSIIETEKKVVSDYDKEGKIKRKTETERKIIKKDIDTKKHTKKLTEVRLPSRHKSYIIGLGMGIKDTTANIIIGGKLPLGLGILFTHPVSNFNKLNLNVYIFYEF